MIDARRNLTQIIPCGSLSITKALDNNTKNRHKSWTLKQVETLINDAVTITFRHSGPDKVGKRPGPEATLL